MNSNVSDQLMGSVSVGRKELLEILQALLEEDLAWFEIRTPSAYIRIGPGPEAHSSTELLDNRARAGDEKATMSVSGPESTLGALPEQATTREERTKDQESSIATGVHAVMAPFAGVFYGRPSPSDLPFVEVGTEVKASDTVCLIEMMKLFRSVPAGVDGRVISIEVNDGEIVEYGQVLVRVRTTPRR